MLQYVINSWQVIFCFLAALVGLVVMVLGARGKKIDDRTRCANCGFDLTETPESILSCPQCQANLEPVNAVVTGRHQRLWGVAATGGVVTVMFLSLGAYLGWQILDRGTRFKPTWMFMADLDEPDAGVRRRALVELTKRLNLGQMSQTATGDLVREALQQQANPAAAWDPNWGSVLEAAFELGHASPQQWQSYLQGIPRLALRTRARIRLGDPIPLALSATDFRVGGGHNLNLSITLESCRIDGHDLPVKTLTWSGNASVNPKINLALVLEPEQVGQAISTTGKRRVTATITISAAYGTGPGAGKHEWRQDIDGEFETVDASIQTVKVIGDPDLEWTTVKTGLVKPSVNVVVLPDGRLALRMQGILGRSSQKLACELFVQAGGSRLSLGTLLLGDNISESFELGSTPLPLAAVGHFGSKSVDVIVGPSIAAALRTIDVDQVLEREVVLSNVALTWSREAVASTQPK